MLRAHIIAETKRKCHVEISGRPYMGITYLAVTDAQTAAQLNVNAYGVYVVDVVQGGPADKAGLKTGDRA